MADINVTFAGIPLNTPIIAEPTGPTLSVEVAAAAIRAGAGAIALPPLDEQRMNRHVDDDEVTEHNMSDAGRNASMRAVRALNLTEYLAEVEHFSTELEAPVIAPIQCAYRRHWARHAARIHEAGAAAVEIRPFVEELDRSLRGDQIERSILRTAARVAGVVDLPVIARIPATAYGSIALVGALADNGVAAVTLRAAAYSSTVDIDQLTLTPPEGDAAGADVAFLPVLSVTRTLYRRVTPTVTVCVPPKRDQALIESLLSGATAVTVPIDGEDKAAAAASITAMKQRLEHWLRVHEIATAVEVRGLVSESRRTSTIEHRESGDFEEEHSTEHPTERGQIGDLRDEARGVR